MTAADEEERTEHVYCCKFPNCGRSYVSSDGVRKHCRKHHPGWLAQLDERAKEERTSHRSALYCTQRRIHPDELAAMKETAPAKRPRRNPIIAPLDDLSAPMWDECASPPAKQEHVHLGSNPYHSPVKPTYEPSFLPHHGWREHEAMAPLSLSPGAGSAFDEVSHASAFHSPRVMVKQQQPSSSLLLGEPDELPADLDYAGASLGPPMLHTQSPGALPQDPLNVMLPDESPHSFFSLCRRMPPIKRGASLGSGLGEYADVCNDAHHELGPFMGAMQPDFSEAIWA